MSRTLVFMVISLVLALIYAYTDWLGTLRNKAVDLAAPFYWVSDLPAKAEDWVDRPLKSRSRLVQENAALRTDLLVLRHKLQKMAALTAQNLRLRELMNAKDTLDDRVLIAEIIGVSPDSMIHKVIIDRGSKHGVYIGQALLDASGLMGQVVEVGKHTSTVLLITDSTHAIPVQINRNGLRLIAEGIGDLYKLSLRHVSNTLDVRVGDLLVSSGLGQRFPVGYPVAEVTEVNSDNGSPFADIVVKPKAELNRSRHVLLVFHTRDEPQEPPPKEPPATKATLSD